MLAVEFKRHTTVTIQGWWSYELPRTLAYVVSDKGLTAFECSTGGGQQCSVSGAAAPGVYYIVFVDAWAAQTVRVEADGPLDLIDVSPQRVACALWRAGVLRGQRITYAFNWPSRPGASVSQDIVEGSCGPPDLQEALAFAAAAGLNATEASLLTRPLGYNVTAVERKYGSAVFYLQPDLTYVVPLALEVQWPNAGRLLLVNPSNVSVTWAVELRLSNKTGSSGVAHGSRLSLTNVTLPPRSVYELYLYGVAREGGSYVFSYRIRAAGSYSWSNYVFYTEGRLVTQNGSFLNWLWGRLEQFWGGVTGDKCAEARGAGRRWAAERIGLAGVVTELDAAAGGAALVTGGYGVVKAAASGARALDLAASVARGYRGAVGVLQLADLLANGVALGFDVYVDVSSGRVDWGDVASAAFLAAGPAAQRVRFVQGALAASGAVALYLGQPLDLAAQLSSDLEAAASAYGQYAQCFRDGALQAFSTFAVEVEVARWVGIASSLGDVATAVGRAAGSRGWEAYRQLAALAAFKYKTPFPLYKYDRSSELMRFVERQKGKFDVLAIDVRKFAIDQEGKLVFLELTKDGGLRVKKRESTSVFEGEKITLDTGEVTFAIYRKRGGHDVGMVLSVGGVRLGTYVGLGRMVGFAALAKDSEVQKARVKVVGRDAEVYRFTLDLERYGLSIVKDEKNDKYYVDVGGGARIQAHTPVKDLAGALMVALGKTQPSAIASEVSLPTPDYLELVRLQSTFGEEIAAAFNIEKKESLTAAWLKLGDPEEGKMPLRLDLLGVGEGGRLVLGEVKAWDEDPDAFGGHFAAIDKWERASGEYVRYLVDAFNGRAYGGEGAYSVFAWPGPMPPVPDLRGPYLFAYGKYKVVGGKIEVYVVFVEATRGELTDDDFLKRLDAEAKDAVEAISTWEYVGRLGDMIADRLAAGGALGELAAQLLRTGGYPAAS
ncbi:hypothetical protein [Pyrobaculum calidifontis]|uniref:hypothetical protein n=1 Tax=Pyrobaculum calidifontis TaxID=181486 RepID=UPI001D01B4C2|nr:hypothetical protein [Pyrobaculum calidifontis]